MRPSFELESIQSATAAVSKHHAKAFSIQLGGEHPGLTGMQYLRQLHPTLFSLMEVMISGFHMVEQHNYTNARTTITFDRVSYHSEEAAEVILHASGWDGFRQAYALSRIARCCKIAIAVDLPDMPAEPPSQEMLSRLLDHFSEETTRSDILYGDPKEYGQRCRSYKVTVGSSPFTPRRFIFRITHRQFENFGLRIGLQAEICKLNASLFGGRRLTDREKVLLVNRWIRENISYLDEDKNADHSAAVTFLRREGVCQGFASLVIAMLQLENIPTIYVRGNITETSSHAWNLVRLDGRWYHLDATWGIHYSDADNPYLLRTPETFPKHTWDETLYSHENNEKRAAAIQRLRRREYSFTLDSKSYLVDQAEVLCPSVAPLILWGDKKMVDMVSLFQFLNLGYTCENQVLTIYTKDRSYSFPVSDGSATAPCQALRLQERLFLSVDAISQIPGFSCAQSPRGAMILAS